jgi:8-oxo-dGTP diphosphatase
VVDAAWADRFPDLFRPRHESYANADLEFRLGAPPDDQVARLHVVAVDVDGLVVVCRTVEEWRFLPGGRRAEGETLEHLVGRELLEEAGCRLVEPLGALFAHQHVTSHNSRPHHPWFPHPESSWGYATARVEIVGEPQIPPDGEAVVEVRTLSPTDAADWLRVHDAEHADVVLLAAGMGLLR